MKGTRRRFTKLCAAAISSVFKKKDHLRPWKAANKSVKTPIKSADNNALQKEVSFVAYLKNGCTA